jgi:ribosome-associated protein
MKTKAVRKPAAVKAAKPARKANPTLALLKLVVQALDAKKAEDLRVLDVSQQSSITDYLVLANGNSEPHLRALRVELEKVLDAQRARILGMDTGKGSGWMVIDAFEVMVHLFTTENRDKYRMEQLWKDATNVSISALLK